MHCRVFMIGLIAMGLGDGPLGLGVGHPPWHFVSNVVNDSLCIVFYG